MNADAFQVVMNTNYDHDHLACKVFNQMLTYIQVAKNLM